MRSVCFSLLLLSCALVARGQVNPHTQIRWPSPSCSTAGKVYDLSSNTCIPLSSMSGQVAPGTQINWPGSCSTPGTFYDLTSNNCLALSGMSGQLAPATQISWPASCNASGMVYNAQSNTCVAIGGVTWRGAWSAGTYILNDMVSYLGSSYISTANGNTATPPSSPWSLVAQAGATGPAGNYPGVTSDGANGLTMTGSAVMGGAITAASTKIGWTDVRTFGVSTSNTATQNQTAFAAVATAVNAGTTPAYIWVPSGTYNVLSTGSTALGAYTTPITFHCQDRNSTILNLSGTGTAISLAPSTTYGSAPTNWVPVVFENCYLTGGTSLTEGIFVGSNNISAKISHNYFWNFGGTSMNAIHTDGISETQVRDNIYIRNDHVLGKFAYSSSVATAIYTYLEALDNVVICTVSTTDANSVACGSGIASDGYLEASRNLMSGPIPDYRCGSQANAQCSISNSNLECFGDPCIMFGTPGSSSAETTNNLMVHDMQVYLNSGTIHVVGPAQSQSKLATSTINNLRLRTGSSQGTVSVPMVAQNDLTGQTGNLYYGNTGWTSNNTTGSNIDAWSTIGGSGTGGYVAAPTVTCTTGQYSADATHMYLCYGTNTWNQVTATAYTNPYQTQDTFTGTAGTLVTAHTDNNSHTWAQYNSISGDPSCGSATLTGSNSATCPGLIGNYFDAINSLAPSSANYVTSGTFAITGSGTAQLFARSSAVARTNYLASYANGGAGTTSLYKCVAATCTQMGSSVSGVWSAGTPHVFALSVSGSATTTVIVTLDGVTKISQTDSSSPITAAGQAGFVISGAASNTISSFTVQ
jgi:hypothetical protein